VVLLLYFWLSGTLFSKDEVVFWMSSVQATGGSLTYSTTTAFLIAAHVYANRLTFETLDQLVASDSLPRDTAATVEAGLGPIGPTKNVATTIGGLVAGNLNVPWDRLVNELGGPNTITALSIVVGNLLTWMVVVHILTRRVLASNAMRRVGREHAHVDLFRLDTLLPFGRLGTQGLLLVAVTVSFTAFQSIDAELRWFNYRSALTAGIPGGLALLLIPMIGIRRNVHEAKRRELARLDEAIAAADRDLGSDPLRYLGDLLQRRETVAHSREWPLDTTALSRVAIYFIIPPIAWVGGAIVEIMVQAGIGSGP
jgi:hypothetical protein